MSLWEFLALITGWNEAHNPEGADRPPAMSDERLDELMAEIG